MDTFWVGVSFFIFLGILTYFGVPKAIIAALDGRGEKVAQELAEARRLRLEAEKLLAEYEAKRKAAETEAASIIAAAGEEAQRLAAEAEAKLNDFVTRRTKSAQEKIAQAESQAEADVRAAAAEAATKAAEIIIRAQVGGKAGDALFATGLDEVKAKLN
ncbi:ATP F0F1 synthase subunit B [Bosea sp. (in: a-proteobacteria)]|uniref:F0F1 ATP synthase subunit B family protein n=1 Tax=Bosea sp. (in: a-proteobacteria) TaxID=1871050 RepID=UPI002736E540|nr:ATP F0F1 synthase subunit B [Bosea sp. (in: a-proteobacteria)]MDP3407175.1 ATP F0F1 synthase subunit B [Bosea sp. (in: a-proteobacteria)]